MLALERQQAILELIYTNKAVKVTDLSQQFNVTEETIRRDLEKLAKKGVVKKTYGGAVLNEQPEENELEDTTFDHRIKENMESKEKIGRAIGEMIQAGETIILDSSTTCLEVAKRLPKQKRMTVITNSVSAVIELSAHEEVTVISTGGTLRTASMSLIGPTAKKNIANYYADKLILSCKGVSLSRGIMESNELEKEIKQCFVEAASQVILAVDHGKINKGALYQFMPLERIHCIVTDLPLDSQWEAMCLEKGIRVVIAE
ncbi:MAG: DeoR/GlpR family DNA-binding transcription regulator [Cellulosilyticaceae bacterium]